MKITCIYILNVTGSKEQGVTLLLGLLTSSRAEVWRIEYRPTNQSVPGITGRSIGQPVWTGCFSRLISVIQFWQNILTPGCASKYFARKRLISQSRLSMGCKIGPRYGW